LSTLLSCAQWVAASERIVSTDAGATEILFALGLEAQLVGVDITSKLPPGHLELPRVGYHRTLPPEGLLALDPTLVIGSEHLGPPKVIDTLQRADIALMRLSKPLTVEALAENVRRIASQLGATEAGEALQVQLAAEAEQLAEHPLTGERVAFLLSIESGKLRVAGQGTAGEAFILLTGGTNAAAFDNYRTLSSEALLEMNPTLLLVADPEGGGVERLLRLNPILNHGTAARRGAIEEVDPAGLVAGISLSALDQAVSLAANRQQAQ
jgi:iron complex transport system substrate-binding protein